MKFDYNYRPGTDTKQHFFITEWTSPNPEKNPFSVLNENIVPHQFAIEKVDGSTEIVHAFAMKNADGTMNEDWIYAYSANKRRRQNRQAAGEYEGACYVMGAPERGYSSNWTYRLYKLPAENVTDFHQFNQYFYMSTITDHGRDWLRKRKRGYPIQQSNGWFPGSHLNDGLQQIAQTIRGLDQKWLDYSSTKYIEIRIDRRDGAFIVKDQNGEIITDPDKLRNIFSGISKPRN